MGAPPIIRRAGSNEVNHFISGFICGFLSTDLHQDPEGDAIKVSGGKNADAALRE
jgi:hypothetical protein